MRKILGLIVSALALAGAAPRPLLAADVLYVKAGRLIVDVTRPPITGGALVITDGVVTAAGANVTAPSGARQLDLSGFTVMPSLLDAHTHLGGGAPPRLPGEPQVIPPPGYAALRAQKNVDSALKLGVAAMRVLGTGDFLDVAIAAAIDDGTIPGPHIIPAAHALSIIGGHGDRYPMASAISLADFYTPLNGFVSSPADAERAVQLQIKYGARVIKLAASGGVGSPLDDPTDPNLSLEEMRIAVEQAHMHHMKVAAHAENARSIMDAMKAGVDSIEHGSELTQEAVDYLKTHPIVLVPTVRVAIAAAGATGGRAMIGYSLDKAKKLVQTLEASFALALKNGVTMAAGSDDSYGPGSTGIIAELVTDVEHGMTPRQALESATLHGAALLGLDQRLGTLAPGMEGDFIAVDGDPLADIHTIENARAVVFKGAVVVDRTKKGS